jgi:hypothetical protein
LNITDHDHDDGPAGFFLSHYHAADADTDTDADDADDDDDDDAELKKPLLLPSAKAGRKQRKQSHYHATDADADTDADDADADDDDDAKRKTPVLLRSTKEARKQRKQQAADTAVAARKAWKQDWWTSRGAEKEVSRCCAHKSNDARFMCSQLSDDKEQCNKIAKAYICAPKAGERQIVQACIDNPANRLDKRGLSKYFAVVSPTERYRVCLPAFVALHPSLSSSTARRIACSRGAIGAGAAYIDNRGKKSMSSRRATRGRACDETIEKFLKSQERNSTHYSITDAAINAGEPPAYCKYLTNYNNQDALFLAFIEINSPSAFIQQTVILKERHCKRGHIIKELRASVTGYNEPICSNSHFKAVMATYLLKTQKLQVDTCTYCDTKHGAIAKAKTALRTLKTLKQGATAAQVLARRIEVTKRSRTLAKLKKKLAKHLAEADCRYSAKADDHRRADKTDPVTRGNVAEKISREEAALAQRMRRMHGALSGSDDQLSSESDTELAIYNYNVPLAENLAMFQRAAEWRSRDGIAVIESDFSSCQYTVQFSSQELYQMRKPTERINVIFCGNNEQATCCMWGKEVGDKGVISTASSFMEWIRRYGQGHKRIIWWADNCGGQVHNWHIVELLFHLVQKDGGMHIYDGIDLKFLETGHSRMICDQITAQLVFPARKQKLFTHRCWREQARSFDGGKHNVINMKQHFHRDWKKFTRQWYVPRAAGKGEEEVNSIHISKYCWFNFGVGEIYDPITDTVSTQAHPTTIWCRKTMDVHEQPVIIDINKKVPLPRDLDPDPYDEVFNTEGQPYNPLVVSSLMKIHDTLVPDKHKRNFVKMYGGDFPELEGLRECSSSPSSSTDSDGSVFSSSNDTDDEDGPDGPGGDDDVRGRTGPAVRGPGRVPGIRGQRLALAKARALTQAPQKLTARAKAAAEVKAKAKEDKDAEKQAVRELKAATKKAAAELKAKALEDKAAEKKAAAETRAKAKEDKAAAKKAVAEARAKANDEKAAAKKVAAAEAAEKQAKAREERPTQKKKKKNKKKKKKTKKKKEEEKEKEKELEEESKKEEEEKKEEKKEKEEEEEEEEEEEGEEDSWEEDEEDEEWKPRK